MVYDPWLTDGTDVGGDPTNGFQPTPGSCSGNSVTITLTPVNISCNGAADGSIAVSVTGGTLPYSYTWSTVPVQHGATATGLSAGTYTVTVTDFWGTDPVGSASITEPSALGATLNSTNVSCNGAADGTISITSPTGGYGTYEYTIDGGANWGSSGSFGPLAPGFYNVQMRDAAHKACVKVLNASLEITQPAALVLTETHTNVTCFGGNDGSIDLTVTGGTAPYNYNWGCYTLGPLEFQNGWDGGIVGGVPVGFTNTGPGDADVVNTVVHNGTQSWYFKHGYGSPGAGTPFTPVVATVGALAEGTQGNQSIITLSFKAADPSGDGSLITVYEGAVNRGDRTGANLYLLRTGSVVRLYTYPADEVNGSGSPVTIAEVDPTVWHTVQMVTDYPFNNPLVYTTWGTTQFYVDGVYKTTQTTWPHWYRHLLPAPYTPGSSIKFNNYATAGNGQTGFYIDDVSMIVKNTVTNTTVGTFTSGFEPAPGCSSQDLNNLQAGVYSVIVTDDHGCKAGLAVTITQPSVLYAEAVPTNVSCNGSNDGSILVSDPIGGNGTWEVSVTGSAWVEIFASGSHNFTGLTPGSYHVYIRDKAHPTCFIDLTPSGLDITQPSPNPVIFNFSYNNVAGTLLNNISIKLVVGSDTLYNSAPGKTDVNGNFTFTNVCPNTYKVIATTTKTKGGVNAGDAAAVASYASILSNPATMDRVKFNAGDLAPDGLNNVLTAGDATRILQYFVTGGNPPTLRGPWTFYNAGPTYQWSNLNAGAGFSGVAYPTVTVGVAPPTFNFYGLCVGDFNRSFTPGGGGKSASETLHLTYNQTRLVNTGSEFDLPLYAGSAMNVGAISLIMNLPSDKVEVLGVYLTNNPAVPVMYNVSGDELRIGWNSLNPLSLKVGDKMLTLKLRANGSLGKNETVRLSLAADPLNELADQSNTVIPDALLYVDVISASALGLPETSSSTGLTLTNYPNPFTESTTFAYTLPFAGEATLEIRDILGSKVLVLLDNKAQTAGDHTQVVGANVLKPGVYIATLKLKAEGQIFVRTIKVVRN